MSMLDTLLPIIRALSKEFNFNYKEGVKFLLTGKKSLLKVNRFHFIMNNVEKDEIINRFKKNVKGKKFMKCEYNYCGAEGHWLEEKMGVKPNPNNRPDLLGYEMKKGSPVTTFVDKQTDVKYFEGKVWKNRQKDIKEKYWFSFERTGSKPMRIGGWDINKWDHDGQCLKVDDKNNINIIYNYNQDKRSDKHTRLSDYYKDGENHIIGTWKHTSLRKTIEDKFNVKGFFICKKNKKGEYEKICFGNCITFDYWIDQFKQGKIYYDGYSSLYGRWRGTFRASRRWWENQLTSEY